MKVIVDLEKKSLKVIENERSIFKGEYGADKLELLINKELVNEYPSITALLSNGRSIGAYTTDESYGSVIMDGVTYTTANFTLSKQNGFTLSEGKMQVTIWMNSYGKREAIGNLLLNVVNSTAYDEGNIIISDDVEGTIVNMREEINNAVSQTNLNGIAVNNLKTNKADITYVNEIKQSILGDVIPEYSTLENIGNAIESQQLTIDMNHGELSEAIYQTKSSVTNLQNTKADKTYVNEKFNQLLGEGASETLDTIGEISKALEENVDVVEALDEAITTKADKTTVALIDNRVTYLEKTKPVTAGAVVNDTLVLFNAFIEGDTLVIVGGDIEDDTLVLGGI